MPTQTTIEDLLAHAPHTPPRPPVREPLPHATGRQAATRFWQDYATATGRASRREFWWTILLYPLPLAITGILLAGALPALIHNTAHQFHLIPTLTGTALALLYLATAIAVSIPTVAVTCRRLHDAKTHPTQLSNRGYKRRSPAARRGPGTHSPSSLRSKATCAPTTASATPHTCRRAPSSMPVEVDLMVSRPGSSGGPIVDGVPYAFALPMQISRPRHRPAEPYPSE